MANKGSQESLGKLSLPLEEGVRFLAGDLERGHRFDKAVLLFALYRAETTRAQAEAMLEAQLRRFGLKVRRVYITPEGDERDLPLWLRWHPPDGDTVIFVYDLRKAFPDALQYLNYRREIFVEERVRAVFWVLEEEARRLALEAPDFWAFRTQVLEFLEVPPPTRRVEIAKELAWWGWHGVRYAYESPEEIEERIVLRERLLEELPETKEATAARAEVYYTLGGLYWAKKVFEQALEHFKQALELARQIGDERLLAGAHNGLGIVYSELGRHEDAIAEYERAIELDPKYALPHTGLGNVYAKLGRYEDAIAEYERAIELDPKFAWPYNNLGLIYERQEEYERAAELYRQAIERHTSDKERAVSWRNLGDVYRALGRYEEAIQAYRKAIELDPKFAYPYANLADVYYLRGEYERAAELYQKSAELQPRARPFVGLAGVTRHLNRLEESSHFAEQARQYLSSDDYYDLACLESITGNVEAALEHLRLALEKEPGLREWAKRDPDLEWIKGDERFWEVVGGADDEGRG